MSPKAGGAGTVAREIRACAAIGFRRIDEPLGRLDAPVAGDQGPGDIGAMALQNLAEPGAAKPKGRSKPARLGPSGLTNGFAPSGQFGASFRRVHKRRDWDECRYDCR